MRGEAPKGRSEIHRPTQCLYKNACKGSCRGKRRIQIESGIQRHYVIEMSQTRQKLVMPRGHTFASSIPYRTSGRDFFTPLILSPHLSSGCRYACICRQKEARTLTGSDLLFLQLGRRSKCLRPGALCPRLSTGLLNAIQFSFSDFYNSFILSNNYKQFGRSVSKRRITIKKYIQSNYAFSI